MATDMRTDSMQRNTVRAGKNLLIVASIAVPVIAVLTARLAAIYSNKHSASSGAKVTQPMLILASPVSMPHLAPSQTAARITEAEELSAAVVTVLPTLQDLAIDEDADTRNEAQAVLALLQQEAIADVQ